MHVPHHTSKQTQQTRSVDVQSGVMFLTQQPIPKTIEDLGQEVTEDVLLARLEHQRALQEEAIRSYKADTLVVGAPKPSPEQSEDSEDDDDGEDSYSQEYDEEEFDEAEEEQQ